ncbi:hypothetical protein BegalDRAFT_0003 [Beggiatoa alba B18LD]|uniref:Terminase small subunit n=1 Tax=Beggiatoa alba B18LD TaxID=395493 RepID=I3CL77_9GAMM|nr:hypothetical protein [Beggiatoa alba]EIJ44370.1 hypothetical protein BegalDRAFT_0003 [Beggiatoa alba B18LD]
MAIDKPQKIETSPHRGAIEAKILQGDSYQSIANWCKDSLDMDISHMSIKRFADKHGLNVKRDTGVVSGLSDDDMQAIVDERDSPLCVDIPTFKDDSELKDFSHRTVKEIYAYQLAVVKHKMLAYMQGKGRYPQNEIAGLKTILACLGGLTDGKDKIIDDDK